MAAPNSPALSACDSMDGIDDLDAFLASQGTLSHFPTPPLKNTSIVQTIEISHDSNLSEDTNSRLTHIAAVLAEEASIGLQPVPEDIELVRQVMLRAELPLEIVALALNMISDLRRRQLDAGASHDTPLDLLVIAVLSLAVSYSNDSPPQSWWWSRHVSDYRWTTRHIDNAILRIFAALDFSLHGLSAPNAIEHALHRLSIKPTTGLCTAKSVTTMLEMFDELKDDVTVHVSCLLATWTAHPKIFAITDNRGLPVTTDAMADIALIATSRKTTFSDRTVMSIVLPDELLESQIAYDHGEAFCGG